MNIPEHHRLMSVKELAEAIRKAPSYVYSMKALGFPMPGGVATVFEARAWLSTNPHPRKRKPLAKTSRQD
jgi:hypothetical protein